MELVLIQSFDSDLLDDVWEELLELSGIVKYGLEFDLLLDFGREVRRARLLLVLVLLVIVWGVSSSAISVSLLLHDLLDL